MAQVAPARSARPFDRRETSLISFSKKDFLQTLCCAIVQRNSNKVRPRHGIMKGATDMKNMMKSLNNWWWRDANTIGRQ